jgi:DNA-binding transcriptional LysR family regulator
MISDLEDEWGVTLLERSRAGVQPTSDGLAMLPYARDLLNSYHRVQEQAASLSGLETGILRIGTFSSVATHWLPAIIKRFQADYPGIRYEFLLGDYTEIEQWIFEGRVDCGFLRLPIKPGYETISLAKDEYVAVLPLDHPLTANDVLCPQDLNGQPFMLLEHGGKTEVSEYLEAHQIKPDIRFTTWDDYAILSMVEIGLDIGVLPRLILQRIPYKVEIRSFSEPLCREIGLAIRNSKVVSASVRKFVEYLKYRDSK